MSIGGIGGAARDFATHWTKRLRSPVLRVRADIHHEKGAILAEVGDLFDQVAFDLPREWETFPVLYVTETGGWDYVKTARKEAYVHVTKTPGRLDGRHHRTTGPAWVFRDGRVGWFLEDHDVGEEEFARRYPLGHEEWLRRSVARDPLFVRTESFRNYAPRDLKAKYPEAGTDFGFFDTKKNEHHMTIKRFADFGKVNEGKVNDILDKIAVMGMDSLSDEERDVLRRASLGQDVDRKVTIPWTGDEKQIKKESEDTEDPFYWGHIWFGDRHTAYFGYSVDGQFEEGSGDNDGEVPGELVERFGEFVEAALRSAKVSFLRRGYDYHVSGGAAIVFPHSGGWQGSVQGRGEEGQMAMNHVLRILRDFTVENGSEYGIEYIPGREDYLFEG